MNSLFWCSLFTGWHTSLRYQTNEISFVNMNLFLGWLHPSFLVLQRDSPSLYKKAISKSSFDTCVKKKNGLFSAYDWVLWLFFCFVCIQLEMNIIYGWRRIYELFWWWSWLSKHKTTFFRLIAKLTLTYPKSTLETLQEGVKYVQS